MTFLREAVRRVRGLVARELTWHETSDGYAAHTPNGSYELFRERGGYVVEFVSLDGQTSSALGRFGDLRRAKIKAELHREKMADRLF